MNKIIFLLVLILSFFGCTTDWEPRQPYQGRGLIGSENLVFEPPNVDTAGLPDMRDLPLPTDLTLRLPKKVRSYTGIIKNRTGYDISVPSGNSSATLTIPANGFIEYTAWKRNFDITVYHGGKPFYCLKINAHLNEYPYMCKKYDFVAEIVKAEPVPQKVYKKKRRIKKKAPKDEGVEGLG